MKNYWATIPSENNEEKNASNENIDNLESFNIIINENMENIFAA